MRVRLRLLGILTIVLSLGLLAACGGDEEAANGESGEHTEEEGEHAEGALHVALNEWSVTTEEGGTDFMAAEGEVIFEVHNDGAVPHELVIVKSDEDPGSLTVEGGVVPEDQVDLIGEVEEFAGGSIETGSFHLEPGNYVLLCNIAGHYEQGMYAGLTVS